jgi:hypothetical protein
MWRRINARPFHAQDFRLAALMSHSVSRDLIMRTFISVSHGREPMQRDRMKEICSPQQNLLVERTLVPQMTLFLL